MTARLGSTLLSKMKSLPEDIVHQGSFIAGHPGGKSEEPELGGDHRGELGRGGAHQEGRGEGDVLPDTPSTGSGHRAHQLQHTERYLARSYLTFLWSHLAI